MKNQLWAGLGSRAVSTCEKKVWGRLWATFEARFLCFHGQKINSNIFWKYCILCTEKLLRIKVKKMSKNVWEVFFTSFRAKHFNVSTRVKSQYKNFWQILADIFFSIKQGTKYVRQDLSKFLYCDLTLRPLTLWSVLCWLLLWIKSRWIQVDSSQKSPIFELLIIEEIFFSNKCFAFKELNLSFNRMQCGIW
jgi:hypothetical protein